MKEITIKPNTLKIFFESLKSTKDILPIYLLLGEEKYLKEEIISGIKKIILKTDIDFSFNFQHLFGSETSVIKILKLANTLPVFSERKLIVIDEAEKLFFNENGKNILNKDEEERFNNYLRKPAKFTTLIFLSDERKLIKDKFKYAGENCLSLIFYQLNESEIYEWIIEQVKNKYKKNITNEAAEKLMDSCEFSLLEIDKELSKLDLYTGEKTIITLDDVNNLIFNSKRFDNFDLTYAIAERNVKESIKIYRNLIESMRNKDKELMMLFGALNNFFHLLWKIKNFAKSGYETKDIMNILDIKSEFRYKKLYQLKEKFNNQDYLKIISLLFEYEKKLKTSSIVEPETLIEEMIYKICLIK